MNIVISQSMYFPWVGFLEQIACADVYVIYDDVQFSKGSFTNRVQVKLIDGSSTWMSVPLSNFELGQNINEVKIKERKEWSAKHMALLEQSFKNAPFANDALEVASKVLLKEHASIAHLSRESTFALADYYGLTKETSIIDSADLNIIGKSSQRVLDIVKSQNCDRYITGHGASNYLDHKLFEKAGVDVLYMQYQCKQYPQAHGEFTPYVSGLDLIAYTGPAGIDYIISDSVLWRDYLK